MRSIRRLVAGIRRLTAPTPCDPVPSFRYAGIPDLPHLVHLERNSDQDDVWSPREFQLLLSSWKHRLIVMEYEGTMFGYLAFQTQKACNVLLAVVVRKDAQRRGIGRALVESLKTLPDEERRRPNVIVMVRESHLGFQLFLKNAGFRYVDTEPEFFDCPPEDAYRFEWFAAHGDTVPMISAENAGKENT